MNQRQLISLVSGLIAVALVVWRLLFPTPDGGTGGGGPTGAEGPCGEKFAFGRPATPATEAGATTFLCRSQYAVLHDDGRKVPLYSAERLVGADVDKSVERVDAFTPDPDLPQGERAELNDYRRSGYDRGHMTPAADSDTDEEMRESFYLSNMVPQNTTMNTGIWASLENATRACAKSVGEVFVLTGPVFDQDVRTIGPDKVEVPDRIYKIVLDARSGNNRAFLMDNRPLDRKSGFSRYEVTIDEVQRATGLTFFPDGKVDVTRRGDLCADAYGS